MSHIGKKYRFLKKYVCILVGLWLRSKPNLAFSKNLSLDPLVALPMEKIPISEPMKRVLFCFSPNGV